MQACYYIKVHNFNSLALVRRQVFLGIEILRSQFLNLHQNRLRYSSYLQVVPMLLVSSTNIIYIIMFSRVYFGTKIIRKPLWLEIIGCPLFGQKAAAASGFSKTGSWFTFFHLPSNYCFCNSFHHVTNMKRKHSNDASTNAKFHFWQFDYGVS